MLASAVALQLLVAHPDLATRNWVARDAAYSQFLLQLQSAIRSGNRRAVANLSAVPLRVNLGAGKFVTYRTRRDIERNYRYIFAAPVRQAILRQRPDELWGRDQGVTLRFGEIWFDHMCLDRACNRYGPVRIQAVNRP